jgi:hypothetical protein
MRSIVIAILSNVHGPIKSRRLRWVVQVARMEENRHALQVLVGKPEGKRQLERRRCIWEENIKILLKKLDGKSGVD